MFLKKLNIINFRSYPSLSISFPPEGALFEGSNGAGKTNLLEAIHLLCTGRSQRGAARGDMIALGEEAAFVEGEFLPVADHVADDALRATARAAPTDARYTATVGAGLVPARDAHTGTDAVTTASLGFSRDKKIAMKRDGAEIASFSEWFGERPVVSFGTDDLELVYGAPETRRRFLDMLISQMDRAYLDALTAYRKAMACRNALFGKTTDAAQFEVYEQAMAEAGAILVSRRAEVITELAQLTSEFYEQICRGGNLPPASAKETVGLEYTCRGGNLPPASAKETVGLEYTCRGGNLPPAASVGSSIEKIEQNYDPDHVQEWRASYLSSLRDRRPRDAELMFTAQGPHRDDLRFLLDNRPAKSYASQGQCRSFALALKLGSVTLLERHKRDSMIFLVDDAVSELDPERTSRVYPLLEGRGQIFIATPRCLAPLGAGILRCAVEPGRVVVS